MINKRNAANVAWEAASPVVVVVAAAVAAAPGADMVNLNCSGAGTVTHWHGGAANGTVQSLDHSVRPNYHRDPCRISLV